LALSWLCGSHEPLKYIPPLPMIALQHMNFITYWRGFLDRRGFWTRDLPHQTVILGRLSFINLPKKALLSVHEAWRQECLISRITHQKLKSPIDSLPCSFHILIDIRNYSGNIFRKATAKGGLQETTLSTRTYAKGLPAWNFKFIAYTSNIYKA